MNLEETQMLHIRVTKKEKDFVEKQAIKYNFRSTSEYIRFLSLNEWKIDIKKDK